MRTTAVMVTAAVALLAGSTLAMAQGPGGGPRGLSQFDEDGDGRVTREEVADVRAGRFASMDVNGDSVLTQDELEAGARAMIESRMLERFHALDEDGDGAVTEAEFLGAVETRAMPRLQRQFSRLDQDGDSAVSRQEFDGFTDRMFARWDQDDDGVIDLDGVRHGHGFHDDRHGGRSGTSGE